VILVLVTGFSVIHPASAQRDPRGFVRVAPEDVRWVVENDGSGVERATIEGDPTKPGLYVTRIKFPPGVMSRNHFHGEDRHAVVLEGTWYTGTGDEFAPDKTMGLKPGSYMKHPAGAHHFDGAKDEEVILQIIGMGPSTTTRLRPQEGNFGPSR
jgi:quercetin dioxygenase-like cupin family protein